MYVSIPRPYSSQVSCEVSVGYVIGIMFLLRLFIILTFLIRMCAYVGLLFILRLHCGVKRYNNVEQ